MEPADIDDIYRWENDPAIWAYSFAHQPFSRHALQTFIDDCSLTDIYAARQLRLMADDGDRTVGSVDLYDFDPFNQRAAIGIIVDSSCRRQGYATAIIAALEQFALQHLNLHQLYCDVACDNTHSLSLFTHCGYSTCATMRQWLRTPDGWADCQRLQKILH